MLIKRIFWINHKFRLFILISILSFIVSYIFYNLLSNRKVIPAIINQLSNEALTIENNKCILNSCTNEQSNIHGDLFKSFSHDWSSCYSDLYLTAFDDHNILVEVLIDIGANKAYAVATWLSYFLPELGINQARLGEYLQSNYELSEVCGSCNDCNDKPIKRHNIQIGVKLKIFAFEPQPGTIDILKGVQNWMNVSQRSNSSLEIHGMAVSDHTGHAFFKKCNAGNEVCSLDVSDVSVDQKVQINITSLDDFAEKNNLLKIDIIKIDTEGYEPLVFRGAQNLLKQQRIRLFIFEHLQEAVWRNTSLKTEISYLSNFGYNCYIIGQTGFIRVSDCWNDKFSVRHNNLLCVSTKDKQLALNIDAMRLNGTIMSYC